MTRFLIIAALFCFAAPAALAVPPAGQGPSGPAATPTASELCKQQRRTVGMATFRELYAPTGKPKAAMDACLVKQVQTTSTQAKNAAMACKVERGTTAESIAAFELKYGTNGNKKNAFGKCVSETTQDAVEAQQDATMNAAKKCKGERALDPAAFKTKYGTNANKRNAFGKCVSKLAKQQNSSS
jgi:hypothetical protein